MDKLDEFSFEANPATFTEKKVRFWRSLGMTRVSLGVQSLDSGILHCLGREHTPAQALHSVEMLKNAGMAHINMDLMFAIPGKPSPIWEATLKEAVSAGTDHISAYNLTYEEDTEFLPEPAAGERQDPDEDASFFELAEHMLEAAGMRHYETSNYAREGCLPPTTWPTGRERTMRTGLARSAPSTAYGTPTRGIRSLHTQHAGKRPPPFRTGTRHRGRLPSGTHCPDAPDG